MYITKLRSTDTPSLIRGRGVRVGAGREDRATKAFTKGPKKKGPKQILFKIHLFFNVILSKLYYYCYYILS